MGRFFQEIADLIIFLKQGFNRATQLHVVATSAFQVRGALVIRQPKSFGEYRNFMISGAVHFIYESYCVAALAKSFGMTWRPAGCITNPSRSDIIILRYINTMRD